MSRRGRLVGFGTEEVAERFPASLEAGERGGRRHGHGLGLRPSRYVGRHRGIEEETIYHKPSRAERRRSRKERDLGFRKAKDFGFGS